MMNGQFIKDIMTNFTPSVGSFKGNSLSWSPSIGITLLILRESTTPPMDMIFTMNPIFCPPFSRTGMAAKKSFRMKIACASRKFLTTIITKFFDSRTITSRFMIFIIAYFRTINFITRRKSHKLDIAFRAFLYNCPFTPSTLKITSHRTIFTIDSAIQRMIFNPTNNTDFDNRVRTSIFNSHNLIIQHLSCFVKSIIEMSEKYCQIAKQRLQGVSDGLFKGVQTPETAKEAKC
jgi:hypothetical protein